ncbi:MAG: type II toxin-antitoxin system HipA family toxin [Polyangiaceae bacterium]
MTPRHGTVWIESHRVGNLTERDGRIGFAYDSSWLRTGFPISLSVPLVGGEHDAHEFFAGLLPEGVARERICRQLRLRNDDDLGLLLEIGLDCAGALAVTVDDDQPHSEAPAVPITADDLSRLIETGGQVLPRSAERPRFSLAGAQHKLAVRVEAGQLWLPSGGAPSSHILKLEALPWVCFAEWAANDMARRLGLPVCEASLHHHRGDAAAPYLLVTRYDRETDAEGNPRRMHQEDMTQALGISRHLKYQEHGGPNMSMVATLVRQQSANPIADIGALRDWQLFNYLVGNSDGHAKNLALLYASDPFVPRLAPFYDLVCIEFLNRLGMRYDRKLAFFIGDNSVPEQVTRKDWTLFAQALGVPAKRLLERLRQFAADLPSHARATRAVYADRFGDNPALDRLEESIRDRCQWTERSVFGRG